MTTDADPKATQLVDPLWKCVEGDRLNPLITFRGHVALIAAKEVIRRYHTPLDVDEGGLHSDSDRTMIIGEETVTLRTLRHRQLGEIAQDVRDLTDVICEAMTQPEGR